VSLSDGERAWRAGCHNVVAALSRLEPNWCVETERVWAVGQNRLAGGRFELSPPAWKLLLERRGMGASEDNQGADGSAGHAKGVTRREYDVDITAVFSDVRACSLCRSVHVCCRDSIPQDASIVLSRGVAGVLQLGSLHDALVCHARLLGQSDARLTVPTAKCARTAVAAAAGGSVPHVGLPFHRHRRVLAAQQIPG
jgi:hypothetical protein